MLLSDGSHSPYAPLVALVGALMLGAVFASVLEVAGFHLSRRLPQELGVADGVGGGVLVACLGLFLVWIAGAVALQTPGARELREPIQRSEILQRAERGAAAVRADPPGAGALRPVPVDPRAGRERAAAELEDRPRPGGAGAPGGAWCGCSGPPAGWACRGAAGSRGHGIVVTNAHVVAGQDDTTVQLGGEGPSVDAQAVWYDPRNDLAILRAPGHRRRAGAVAAT